MGCTCIREEREGNRVIKTHKLKPRRIFTHVLFIGGTLITKRGSNLNQWAGEYYNTVPEYHQEYTSLSMLSLYAQVPGVTCIIYLVPWYYQVIKGGILKLDVILLQYLECNLF